MLNKKKNMTNWHKTIPLNKEIVARVEDVNFGPGMIQVSLAYINNKSNVNFETYFAKNKMLVSCFKKPWSRHIRNKSIGQFAFLKAKPVA